jgi:hypothetical protein
MCGCTQFSEHDGRAGRKREACQGYISICAVSPQRSFVQVVCQTQPKQATELYLLSGGREQPTQRVRLYTCSEAGWAKMLKSTKIRTWFVVGMHDRGLTNERNEHDYSKRYTTYTGYIHPPTSTSAKSVRLDRSTLDREQSNRIATACLSREQQIEHRHPSSIGGAETRGQETSDGERRRGHN